MKIAEVKDLVEEMKGVSSSLNMLACVIAEGIGTGDRPSEKWTNEIILNATSHLDRIADEMLEKLDS